ncbi:glycosyltransferase family 2 protein [Vibrio alginolyticus]|uniref:glycosyltransferase family 2 protein n=1 Tax=Vibrio alginolyticus TaxID=663 RepID=UPI00215B9485|nr:glycosyltransferase family 2 protein [Vibrio alginolyticus]MCR9541622.1 glycosyltransferase [Vibrio alginolyticus]
MKVSVLIPVYGVEKYLRVFLDSLCQQTLDDVEFIIVNDASPDRSNDIIQEYLSKDERFTYINKTINQGEMQARQDAYNLSQGEYVINLDSDDYISPTFLESLYSLASENNLDMVLSNVVLVDEIGTEIKNEYRQFRNNMIFNESNICQVLSLPYSSWSRMTKREVLEEYSYSYLQGETTLTKLQFVNGIKSGLACDAKVYYRQRAGSLSSFENSSRKYKTSYGIERINHVLDEDISLFKKNEFSNEFKVFRFVNMAKLIFLSNINNGGVNNYKEEIRYLKNAYGVSYKELFYLLKYLPFKTKLFSYSLFLNMTPFILHFKRK